MVLSPQAWRENWGVKRRSEAQGKRILTYCVGCATYLNRLTPTYHILDLFYEPEATLSGKVKASKAPITYWNRIRLKRRFQNYSCCPKSGKGFSGEEKESLRELYRRITVLLFSE